MSYEVVVNGAARRVELPFVCGVLGAFSGQPGTPLPPLSDRPFIMIDAENFDAILASIGPRLAFAVPSAIIEGAMLSVTLTFASLADFAPGRVAMRVPEIGRLLESRAILGPKMDVLLDRQLAEIVHHPAFRELEGIWRGLHRLVTRWDRCDEVSVCLWDVDKRDVSRNLKKFRGTAWDESPLFKKVYNEAFAIGQPFGLLIGCFEVDHSPQDVQLLGDMSQIAAACEAPFVTSAAPTLLQMDDWSELDKPRDLARIFQLPEYAAWRSLRESEDARYLVLTLPRYVARPVWHPAGSDKSLYRFRERIDKPAQVVWANAALLLAENVMQSILLHGWGCHIAGLVSGGAVEELPECLLGGAQRPVDMRVDMRRDGQLRQVGLTALVARDAPGLAEFVGAVSLSQPQPQPQPQPQQSATDTSLAATLILCRLGQYVRALMADGILCTEDPAASQRWFDAWVADYVEPPSELVTSWSAPRPLAVAKLVWSAEATSRLTVQAAANPRFWGHISASNENLLSCTEI